MITDERGLLMENLIKEIYKQCDELEDDRNQCTNFGNDKSKYYNPENYECIDLAALCHNNNNINNNIIINNNNNRNSNDSKNNNDKDNNNDVFQFNYNNGKCVDVRYEESVCNNVSHYYNINEFICSPISSNNVNGDNNNDKANL
eukprot:Pgem_evm1s10669